MNGLFFTLEADIEPDGGIQEVFQIACPSSEQSGGFEAVADGGFGASRGEV
jgi:hypothetical protein